jgi:hypothetical protein
MNAHRELFLPSPFPYREFIPTENPSPLQNTIFGEQK